MREAAARRSSRGCRGGAVDEAGEAGAQQRQRPEARQRKQALLVAGEQRAAARVRVDHLREASRQGDLVQRRCCRP